MEKLDKKSETMTSSENKRKAEWKHRLVTRFLEKEFPDCTIIYNGVEGFDHKIIYGDREVIIETRTCQRIIRGSMAFKGGELLYNKTRLGMLKFDNREWNKPYKVSQHRDLINLDGWYIFVIGNNIISGTSAKELDRYLSKNRKDWKLKRICWANILNVCYPDWIEKLKQQVY